MGAWTSLVYRILGEVALDKERMCHTISGTWRPSRADVGQSATRRTAHCQQRCSNKLPASRLRHLLQRLGHSHARVHRHARLRAPSTWSPSALTATSTSRVTLVKKEVVEHSNTNKVFRAWSRLYGFDGWDCSGSGVRFGFASSRLGAVRVGLVSTRRILMSSVSLWQTTNNP